MGTERLNTERLELRRHKPEDAPVIYEKIGKDPGFSRYTGWNPYASPEMAEETIGEFIENYSDDRFYGWAIDYESNFVGTVGAYDYNDEDKSVEIGCSIVREYWGKGFGGEACQAVCSFLSEKEGIKRVVAWCASENTASARILEKCGFELRNREKFDVFGTEYEKLIYSREYNNTR